MVGEDDLWLEVQPWAILCSAATWGANLHSHSQPLLAHLRPRGVVPRSGECP